MYKCSKQSKLNYCLTLLIYCFFNFGCHDKTETPASVYKYIAPEYRTINLNLSADTIRFILNDHTYNAIKSFNLFSEKGQEYISFYDERSQSINIYNYQNQRLVKKILLKKVFKKNSLHKTTVYCRNFDSIFINNLTTLYLIDGNGEIKKSIDFLTSPRNAWAKFENTSPPIIKGTQIYAAVRPYVDETSLSALKKWKVLYRFDLQNSKAVLYYHLPQMYQNDLYGYHLLNYNYCFNNQGNFVFSFPADTFIYETNLIDYHVAYNAKSRFQTTDIAPIGLKDLKGKDAGLKQYKLRDSYGPIFYDHKNKRYLRLAKQKIKESEYDALKRDRKQSVIILNDEFKIIGEPKLEGDFDFSTIFFTANGDMYGRVNAKDEYAIHFVRLEYKESGHEAMQLTKNELNLSK